MTIIGLTSTAEQTPPVSGLTDWYPRGISQTVVAADVATAPFSLSTSSTGNITVAIKADQAWVSAHPQLWLRLVQRRTDDLTYQQYKFTLAVATATISGVKDDSGKNLIISSQAFTDGRVKALVNGVVVDLPTQSTANSITLPATYPIGTYVEVLVYSQKPTITRDLKLIANQDATTLSSAGSWGNVNWAEDNSSNKWFVYSCTEIGKLPNSAKFKVDGIYPDQISTTPAITNDALFLLASSPFENVDRYMNYNVSISALKADFYLTSSEGTTMELNVDANFIIEIFPPLKLIRDTILANSSFITNDTYTTTTSISTNTTAVRLSGVKIIGPV